MSASVAPDRRIPAMVVTGFLGSGKTTFLNHLLRQQHGRKLAVIINEFGETSIDGQLVETGGQEQIAEFNNGCLCCTHETRPIDINCFMLWISDYTPPASRSGWCSRASAC